MPEKRTLTDDIFIVAHFLSPGECDAYIALTEGMGCSEAPINTPCGPQLVSSVRNNKRLIVDDPVRAWDPAPHLGHECCGTAALGCGSA